MIMTNLRIISFRYSFRRSVILNNVKDYDFKKYLVNFVADLKIFTTFASELKQSIEKMTFTAHHHFHHGTNG